MQPVGAFKIRGAYNFIAQLSPELRSRGLLACSSGNHGQAVALAAKKFGVSALIVMPRTAVRAKVEGIQRLGAEIVFCGTTSEERRECGDGLAGKLGLTLIPPYNDKLIIAGQGTISLELLDQRPDLTSVYVPIGGGGLISGVAAVLKKLKPSVRVIGVEPAGAAKMKAALEAGRPVRLDKVCSIADGLLAEKAGDLTYAYVREFVDKIVTVEEHEIAAAVVWLFQRARLVVEPSGAVAVAAVLKTTGGVTNGDPSSSPDGQDAGRRGDKVAVAVLSGGNIDIESLNQMPVLATTGHLIPPNRTPPGAFQG
jgi:threonine dehydratase